MMMPTDRGSKRRGILTDKYMIEPFFEYYGGIDETQSPRLNDRTVFDLLQNDVDLTVIENTPVVKLKSGTF